MKRIIALLLVLATCFSLCACGKSEAVKNVEGLIDAIGEVTAESESAIVAAVEAYNALNEEEKAKVENYAVLTAAKECLNECILDGIFLGEWVNLRGGVLVLNGDKSFSYIRQNETLKGFFEYVENGIILDFEIIEYSLELQEIDDIQYLISQEAGMALVKSEYASTSEHEISIENWQDYFTIEKETVERKNAFGEIENIYYFYCLILKNEYANRLASVDHDSNYGVAVEVSYNRAYKAIDYIEGEVVVTGIYNYFDNLEKEIKDIKQSLIGDYLGIKSIVELPAKQASVGPEIAYEFTDYDSSGDWGLIACDNFGVSRIQGTLLLYDLPLQNEIIRNLGMHSGVEEAPAAPGV